MRISSFVLFGIAALLGIGAVMLAMNWLEGQRNAPQVAVAPDRTNVRKVVVASQPLRFGSEVTAVVLKEVEWPVGAVPAGSFLSMADLTKPGERRVVLAAIEKDEPVLAWKVTGAGQRASLSAVIGSDKTAVTIRVNDVSGTAGFVLPGDRVDVLLTRSDNKNGNNGGFTDVLLQNVRALAVDQLADERSEKPSVAKAVTLEVSQTEAQRLALAQTVGQLSLALRPAGDTKEAATHRIGMSDLGDLELPPAVALAPSMEPSVAEVAVSALPRRATARVVNIGVTRGIARVEVPNVFSEKR